MIRFLFDPALIGTPSAKGPRYHHQIYASIGAAHTATVLPELASPYEFGTTPANHQINVYFAHRTAYRPSAAVGEISVFHGHGIADKAWRTPDRVSTHHFVCTSGPAWTERYRAAGWAPDRVLEIGYPKLDPLYHDRLAGGWSNDGRVRVVWAPTHDGVRDRPRTPGDPKHNAASTQAHRDLIRSLLPPTDFEVVEAPQGRGRTGRSPSPNMSTLMWWSPTADQRSMRLGLWVCRSCSLPG